MLLIFYFGLGYWALSDWRHQSVPALPFDSWCLLLIAYQLLKGSPWWPVPLFGLAFCLCVFAGWLGAADAWLIAVYASVFSPLALLWLLLISCLTGIIHAYWTTQRRIPWLPHLALAAAIVHLVITK